MGATRDDSTGNSNDGQQIVIECPRCHHDDVRVIVVTMAATSARHVNYGGYPLTEDGFVMDDLLHLDLGDYSTEDEEAMCYNCYWHGPLDIFGFGQESAG